MSEKRKGGRVEFSRGIDVQMVAVDGTWRRPCVMLDVAANGAKLSVKGSIEGLNLTEFFLILSTAHHAFRRCELVWLNGDQLGVQFLANAGAARKSPPPPTSKQSTTYNEV